MAVWAGKCHRHEHYQGSLCQSKLVMYNGWIRAVSALHSAYYIRLKNLGILQRKIPALLTIIRRREQATTPSTSTFITDLVYITYVIRRHRNILPRLFLPPWIPLIFC